ncbi:chromosomal replication initiator protein DnaA [Ancylobacter sp. IITR112]|uniref:chromosomal replication initiator protein DnaA n=1 Tax=Ancylobacter sp. IITR112 TaxID=3138073 RepID=UPI003529F808
MIEMGDALPPGVTDAAGLMRHYKELRARMLAGKLRPRLAALRPAPSPEAAPMLEAEPVAAEGGLPLNPSLTFPRFHAGAGNRLPLAMAQRVADAVDDGPAFNPLVLHGGAGLGKTHLLQAIVATAREAGRRALYLSAEAFLLRALGAGDGGHFLQTLDGVVLLAIDDAQGLRSRAAQAALLRVMQHCAEAGRQMVLAMDTPPGDFATGDERLASRLCGGLALEVEPPDLEARRAMAEMCAAEMAEGAPGFAVPGEVLAYIAQSCPGGGRQLDGAMNRLLAFSGMGTAPVTMETAETAMRGLTRCAPPPVRVDSVIRAVARHYKVTPADILSQRRTANVVKPRQIAMYLAKTLTLRSLPEVGRRFAGRDHTTVLYAVRKIERLIAADAALAAEVAGLTAAIREGR